MEILTRDGNKDMTPAMRKPLLRPIAGIALFVGVVVAAAGLVACGAGLCGARLALGLTLGTLALQLVPVGALALPAVVERLRRFLDDRPARIFVIAAMLFAPYLLYWTILENPLQTGVLWLLAWVMAPTALAVFGPRGDRMVLAGDALVVVAIWLPYEFHWIQSAYPWPGNGAGSLLSVPLGLGLLVFLTVVVRRMDGVGYVARIDPNDLMVAARAFGLFALAGIPIGLLSGFLRPTHRWAGAWEAVARAVMIFLFTALPEEICFRGLIQKLIERGTGRRGTALAIASILFGLAHLNNGPAPDWRYALLATLAGLAYGWTFLKTGRLAAPALVHMLVDLTWSLAFKG